MSIDDRSLNMEQMRCFLEVARRENISLAARTLNISQPALSRKIRAFEEDIGWDLLNRGGKSIQLTRAGEIVRREGEKLMKRIEASFLTMEQQIEGVEMRIGYAPSLAEGLIDRAMEQFLKAYPRVRVSWFDCSTQEMWDKLEAGELDLILEVAANTSKIEWETLRERDNQVAIPIRHPLAKKRFIKPEHLNNERLLLLSRHEYPGYWQNVTQYFGEHNINAKVAGEFDGISSLMLGVEANLGLAFVAEGSVPRKGVKLFNLKPKPTPICVSLGWKRGRSLEEWEQYFLQNLKNSAAL